MMMQSCRIAFCVILYSAFPSCRHQIGRTEWVKDNLNPDFTTPITLQYYFEEVQTIRFDLFVHAACVVICASSHNNAVSIDVDDFKHPEEKYDVIGTIVTTVGALLSNRSKPMEVHALTCTACHNNFVLCVDPI